MIPGTRVCFRACISSGLLPEKLPGGKCHDTTKYEHSKHMFDVEIAECVRPSRPLVLYVAFGCCTAYIRIRGTNTCHTPTQFIRKIYSAQGECVNDYHSSALVVLLYVS